MSRGRSRTLAARPVRGRNAAEHGAATLLAVVLAVLVGSVIAAALAAVSLRRRTRARLRD